MISKKVSSFGLILSELALLNKNKFWMQKAFGKHKGALHKALGVPEGEKIPVEKLKVHKDDSTKMKKRKILAQTAEKINK